MLILVIACVGTPLSTLQFCNMLSSLKLQEPDDEQVLVLSQPQEDAAAILQQPMTEIHTDQLDVQAGEYAIVEEDDDMITLQHEHTGHTINMSKHAVQQQQ